MPYPKGEIDQALRDLLLCEFHDILPGSSIEPAEQDALAMLGHGFETICRAKTRAFFALCSGQKKARPDHIPILIHNPHPYPLVGIFECEFNLPQIEPNENFNLVHVRSNGRLLPSQSEQELSGLPYEWRKRIVFAAKLEPSKVNRFDCELEPVRRKPTLKLRPRNGRIRFKTDRLDVTINTRTGLVDKLIADGRQLLAGGAFAPLVMHDNADPWGMIHDRFNKVAGQFKLMTRSAAARFAAVKVDSLDPVRVIEDGPVRSVVEALLEYGDSFICQRYKLPKHGTEIELETRVYFNEKDHMLKLALPVLDADCDFLGQVAYGREQFPTDGREIVAQKWVAIVSRKRDATLTCINNGTYSSDFSPKGLRLSLLRSPAYSCHPRDGQFMTPPNDRFTPRIDQGMRMFRFWFNIGRVNERLKHIDREALARNEEPFILSFSPSGAGKKPKPLALLDDDVVQISAMKIAEKGRDLIVRLFNPTDRSRSTTLHLPALARRIRMTLGAFEIRTLKINTNTGKWRAVNLLERPIPKR
jgi:alpha-mannosidase